MEIIGITNFIIILTVNRKRNMFQGKVLIPSQLPIPQKSRRSTDIICIFIGAAFAITMFVSACVMWNKDKFSKQFLNYAYSGTNCSSYELNYVEDPQNFNTTICTLQCPANYYAVQGFCLPLDDQKKLQLYLDNPQISSPIHYSQLQKFKWVIFFSLLISFSLGFLWIVFVQCLPRFAPIVSFLLGAGSLIALGATIIISNDRFWNQLVWLKFLVPIICFILALILIVMLFLYSNEVKFQALFLDYSTRFLYKHPVSFLHLPIFIICMFGLIVLILWQHCCFSSKFSTTNNIQNLICGGAWEVFNIIELIWGVQFIRDAFTFCLSSNAADYYWVENQKQSCLSSYGKLLCSHWGSVVGGSFLNAFFQIPTLIAELFVCHPTACCHRMGVMCYNDCNFLGCLFDLIRTDSYAYINIAGIPFCNSSQQCKKICSNSKLFVGSYSPIKHYRFAAHTFSVSIVFLISLSILHQQLLTYGVWNLAILVFTIYTTITLFIGIHADSAESLQTYYLCEHQLQPNQFPMQKLHTAYLNQLGELQKNDVTDGNC